MRSIRFAKSLALVACTTLCSFSEPAENPRDPRVEAAPLGFVELRFEDSLQDWSLQAPSGADSRSMLQASGKIVIDGEGVVGGHLDACGEALRLVHTSGEVRSISDLELVFGDKGLVQVRCAGSELFVIDNLQIDATPEGGLFMHGDVGLGRLAAELAMAEARGTRVATAVIGVDPGSVRRVPTRQTLADPEALGTSRLGGTPDVIVFEVGVDGGDTNDIAYYGQSGGIAAYSIATQSCNKGTAELDWQDSNGQTTHPVIAQNMFRYKDGRLEQLGQSWLKHGFCALSEVEAGCSPCGATNCDTLGVGCADTYWATLNDGRNGGSKRYVNPTDGTHNHGSPAPVGNNTTRGRLQVDAADMDPALNVGAQYFIESQYITADDAQANAGGNNASWRRVVVNSINDVNGGGPTNREDPGIYAWQDQDASVVIRILPNGGEVSGLKSFYYLGYRVTAIGNGQWRYEYALQNLNSDQSARSFSIDVPRLAAIQGVGFHDVAWHSGDPYSGTDWAPQRSNNALSWSTDDFATDPDANALRWGTMYNFYFVSDSAPVLGDATIQLFKPGTPSEMVVSDVLVPSEGAGRDFGGITGPGSGTVPSSRASNGLYEVNPHRFHEASPAVLGGVWRGIVELRDADSSVMFLGLGGPTEGTLKNIGEVLVRPPLVRQSGDGLHSIQIPNDASLMGATLHTQAATVGADGLRLTNALQITIGAF